MKRTRASLPATAGTISAAAPTQSIPGTFATNKTRTVGAG